MNPAPPPALPKASADPLYRAALATALLAVGLRLTLLFAAPNTAEDFYITLRYAANLATGHGFVYNPGERVLGTTTPLYTLFLALLLRLHLDPILGGKLLNILADGAACLCVYRLGRAASYPGAGLLAALCVALAPVNLTWAGSGMESSLVAATGVAAWMAWAERRERLAWAMAALLILLRIYGAALAVMLLVATLARERRTPWRGLLVFGVLLLPWLLFATVYFGSPIPTSLRAKLIFYDRYFPTPLPHLSEFLRRMLLSPPGIVVVPGLLLFAAFTLRRNLWNRQDAKKPFEPPRRQERQGKTEEKQERSPSAITPLFDLLVFPFCWIALYYAGMAFSKVFLFGWYFVPPTPIAYLIGLVGWGLFAEWRGFRRFDLRRVAPWLVAAGWLMSVPIGFYVERSLRRSQSEEENLRVPIAFWLRDHAAPTDTVMLEPIGYIGYFSSLRVLDTVGLASPEVLPFYRPDVVSPHHALWTRFAPTWVLLRAGEWRALLAFEARLPPSQRLEARYALARVWPQHSRRYPLFLLYHKQ